MRVSVADSLCCGHFSLPPFLSLQRAKELHPDLNAQWSASDGEAFLTLVTAYEVLSDPQQRQVYDMSQIQELPGMFRRAASATTHPPAHGDVAGSQHEQQDHRGTGAQRVHWSAVKLSACGRQLTLWT